MMLDIAVALIWIHNFITIYKKASKSSQPQIQGQYVRENSNTNICAGFHQNNDLLYKNHTHALHLSSPHILSTSPHEITLFYIQTWSFTSPKRLSKVDDCSPSKTCHFCKNCWQQLFDNFTLFAYFCILCFHKISKHPK